MFRRFLLLIGLSLCFVTSSWASSKIDYRYWFDNDSLAINSGHSAANAWQMKVDVSGLSEAIHTIHLQAIDKDGAASTPVTRYFLKTSMSSKPVKVVYCIDDVQEPLATSTVTNGTLLLDVSQLPDGFHYLHVQAVGNQVSPSKTYCFIKTPIKNPNAQLNILCDIDGIRFKHEQLPANGGIISWELDVTSIPQGLHHMQVQAIDDEGVASRTFQSFFLRVPTTEEQGSMNCICWIDGQIFKHEKLPVHGGLINWVLDVTQLPQGLHFAQVQVVDDNGIASRTYQSFFLRDPTTEERGELNCICWIDGEIFQQEKLPIQGGMLNWVFDVSSLPQGIHYIQVQAQDGSGVSSRTYQSFFMRVATTAERGSLSCYYDIDGEDSHLLAANMVDGAYHFDIDVTQLEDGPHRLSCMLTNTDGDGSSSRLINRYFIKVPVGGYGVKHYQYWLNDSLSEAVDVTLDQPADPFKLISLLPFDHWPIRSSSFEFKVEDGQPVIYARNDMHVRFFDASDRFVDVNRTFTDPVVKRDVNEFTLIQPGETKSAPRPQKDEIIWYKVEALHGDSLSFKADRACTIQVFSPTGEELRSASAEKSVQWCGAHAPMDGTYYIAQHDMTATQGSTLAISYQHIDQYAILDYDVLTVGNGGASTITFNGNGFDDLYAIDLIDKEGNKISHQYLHHNSNACLEGFFDFYGCAEGDYDAHFSYVEGEIFLPNAIHVEAPKPVIITSNVNFPSSYLVGNPVTYTLSIKNTGNMTAFAVPIDVDIITNRNSISYIYVSGLGLDDIWKYDDLSEDERDEMKTVLKDLGHDYHFIKYWDKNDAGTDSVVVRHGMFLTNISPYSTKIVTITIKSDEIINALFSVADTVNAIITTSPNAIFDAQYPQKVRRKTSKYCCYQNQISCTLGVLSGITNFANIVASAMGDEVMFATIDCAAGAISDINNVAGDIFCSGQGNQSMWQKIKNGLDRFSLTATVGSCLKKFIPAAKVAKAIDLIQSSYGLGIGNAFTAASCFSKPNSDPDCLPKPKGGSSSPRRSCEPNDMLGYTAPSGSHHIGNGLTDVYYTIQFENDSAATSPANVIILTDTIDARYFDLNTFAPTQVKIGDVTAQLSGEANFIQTVDMRPRINCLAQVECNYNAQKGIAVFTLTSLDPMTLERVTDYNQGMLPPNGPDNMGQGEMSFNISLKPGLSEGTVIKNHADNIFDTEDPVFTPDWVNIIDGVKPTSRVIDCELLNDSVAAVSIRGEDDRSGPWRYDIYAQYGGGDWYKAATEVPIDHAAQVRVYEGIEHHFYAVLTDSAGNVEVKEPVRELTFDYFSSDTETNLTLNLAKGWNWMSHNLNEPLSVDALKPNAYRIMSHDGETINDPRYGYTGTVSTLSPTELYKVEMSTADNIQLSGKLFNSALKPVPLVQGWNWIGYPMAGAMSVNEALVLLDADEDDCIVGQDGTAVFNDGLWRGTLTTLEPGKGYLLKVNSDKSLRFNTSRSSVRLHAPAVTGQNEELPWTVDIHRYPNVTPIIADLWDGNTLTSSLGYALAAFVDDECRGIATEVNGRWMMNVFGNGGETVTFKALDRNTGLVHDVTETQSFTADLLGTMAMPVQLHIADGAGLNNVTYDDVNVKPTMTTGPVTIEASVTIDDVEVINMAGMTIMGYSNIPSGFTLDLSSEPDGVYLVKVHTGSHISTVKVMKRSR